MIKDLVENVNRIVVIAILTLTFALWAKASFGWQDYCLNGNYKIYKENYMSKDGRIIDSQRNNVTTSEGQAYMLLRSCLMGDKKTFDLVYTWSKNNLQRKDKLFAWLWGETKNGEYKVIDENSASDADVDIAFALILANEKWQDKKYLDESLLVINSIWDNETKKISSTRVLMPGVLQTKSDKIEVNPSYFSPYAFRQFQKYDEKHDWGELINSSYYYLNQVCKKTKTGLPPDWFLIKNSKIVLEPSPRSDFSYDAIRVFPRVYLDYKKSGEKRAMPILAKTKFFVHKWKKDKTLYVNYKANGELKDKNKFIGSIGVLVPVIALFDPKTASEIYVQELLPNFNEKGHWDNKNDYYARNLLWFGCYFYQNYQKGKKSKWGK